MLFATISSILGTETTQDVSPRRRFLLKISAFTFSGGIVGANLLAPPTTLADDQKPAIGPQPKRVEHELVVESKANDHRAVKVVFEARGNLLLNAPRKPQQPGLPVNNKIQRIALEVRGELEFAERLLTADADHSIRHYDKASAKIKIGKGGVTPELPKDRRLIVARKANQLRYGSPEGPIQRGDLDLLRTAGDVLALDGLLPGKKVAPSDRWETKPETWARLLALDSVTKAEVPIRLTNVQGAIALIEFEGKVDGAINGVATEIDVRGKMNVDKRLRKITWFTMSNKEKRSIGVEEPGIEATSRLRVAIQPTAADQRIAAKTLGNLPLELNDSTPILAFRSSKIGFSLIHEARWRLMFERPDVAVLRMVDDGTLIAQCNISRLTPRAADKPFTLNDFQTDIQKSLDTRFGQFVEAAEYTADSGDRVLRAAVTGAVQEVTIQWIYYHITNAKGDRLSVVFTLDAKLADDFAGQDRTLANSVRILDAPAPIPATSGSGT